MPVLPTFAATPTLLPKGIFQRASLIGTTIKNNIAYTEADGKDLGLEGAEIIPQDTSNAKPVISLRLTTEGRPEIIWSKDGMDGIEIQKQDEQGVWQLLDIDMKPNYTDMSQLPAQGKGVMLKYRAIYRQDDKRVGQWSDVASISVHGDV